MGKGFLTRQGRTSRSIQQKELVFTLKILEYKMRAFGQTTHKVALP